MDDAILSQLITMSRNLGNPALDYAILGEGNTSARIDAETFWVKASGAPLRALDRNSLVQVYFDPILALLENEQMSDVDIRKSLESARVDPEASGIPSVETSLHALVLQLDGVDFVGHTHPTVINAILCSQHAAEAISGRLFPDEIVYCGPAPVYVPYTDPGLPLARAVRQGIIEYAESWGQAPKVILMQNHGFIALGKSTAEVENITAMAVKAARVLLGTYSLGGPHFLTTEQAERINTRPDEHYRKDVWGTR
jgi:rhamnose utilization protein RhaD (predicted bifunctional aldolase and dehydrogenase)